jgi:thiosulfate/3-mercaptopyruvate sulfurtransferase
MRKPLQLLMGGLMLSATTACLVSMPESNPLPEWEPALLVSTAQLATRLNDPRTVIVHVGTSRAGYDAGHVPGARFLALSSLVTERAGLPNELPAPEALEAAFEGVGVGDPSRVVLYGDLGGLAAARAFFALDYLGKRDAALLDGGLEQWKAEGRPVETAAPSSRQGALTVALRPEIVADADYVLSRLENDSSIVLIDARPSAEFSGEAAGEGVARPGHVPGAHSIPWRAALVSERDARLRSPQVLAASYTLADAAQGDTVIVYARTGVEASHAYFVARYLERPAKLYDGSYLDWSRRGDAYPVER